VRSALGLTAVLLVMAGLVAARTHSDHRHTLRTTQGTTHESTAALPPGDGADEPTSVDGATPSGLATDGGPVGGGHGSRGTSKPPVRVPSTLPVPPSIPPVDDAPVPIPPGRLGACPVAAPVPISDRSSIGPGLYLATADGKTLTRLLPTSGSVAWTPDGIDLTYTVPLPGGRQVALCVWSADAAPLHELYEGYVTGAGPQLRQAEWAHNQRHVAFVIQDPADNFHLKLLVGDAAAKSFEAVAGSDDPDAYTWLHGSSRIAYGNAAGTWSVGADGSLPAIIDPRHTPSANGLQLSPDGTRFAFVDRNYNLDVVNVNGTGFRQLWSSPSGEIIAFAWAPDGRQLVVDGNDGQPGLFVVGADGSSPHRVADDFSFFPAWSPDGSAIAYSEAPIDVNYESLRLISPDGRAIRTLATTAPGNSIVLNGGWHPDGERIVFAVYARTQAAPSS